MVQVRAQGIGEEPVTEGAVPRVGIGAARDDAGIGLRRRLEGGASLCVSLSLGVHTFVCMCVCV